MSRHSELARNRSEGVPGNAEVGSVRSGLDPRALCSAGEPVTKLITELRWAIRGLHADFGGRASRVGANPRLLGGNSRPAWLPTVGGGWPAAEGSVLGGGGRGGWRSPQA